MFPTRLLLRYPVFKEQTSSPLKSSESYLTMLPAFRSTLNLLPISEVDFVFPFGVDGGAKEDRTPDLLLARQALSQLSYGPTTV